MEDRARRGRAAAVNPVNRFERFRLEEDFGALTEDERRAVPTIYFEDASRSILSRNESPDVPFTYGINVYRGCEHGCAYCYARPTHEFLGFSSGLDFETRIMIKQDAPALLEKAFQRRSWQPQVVAMSGNTDPYQPVERKLALTRRCLEVFLRHRNPVSIITKNHLVTRDLDLLRELARLNLVTVTLSVTSLLPDLIGKMEPRTSRPAARLSAIKTMAENGIPTGVNVAPIIPGLNDEAIPAIMKAAAQCGATYAGYQMVRLPGTTTEVFTDWVRRSFPDRAEKVLSRIRRTHGGELDDSTFRRRMRGEGPWARIAARLFTMTCASTGLNRVVPVLSTEHFRRLPAGQLSLL